LNRIEAAVPAGKLVHAILDNYAAHKHPKVRAWLARHPRWTLHFTPTSCSWANAVEGFFATLTRRRLQRGVFRSLVDLQAALNRYPGAHNRNPNPFVWTADPDHIIVKRVFYLGGVSMKCGLRYVAASSAPRLPVCTSGVDGAPGQYELLVGAHGK